MCDKIVHSVSQRTTRSLNRTSDRLFFLFFSTGSTQYLPVVKLNGIQYIFDV